MDGLLDLAKIGFGVKERAQALADRLEREIALGVVGFDGGVPSMAAHALQDALIHLMANAVDHGIEPPQDRAQAGKPRAGRLLVSLLPYAAGLRLVVEDDGRGLQPGVVDDQIFSDGFTTRANPSETSGRGVGLAAVRRALAALGGSIAVERVHPHGTRMIAWVPIERLALVAQPVRALKGESLLFWLPVDSPLAEGLSAQIEGRAELVEFRPLDRSWNKYGAQALQQWISRSNPPGALAAACEASPLGLAPLWDGRT